MSDRIALNADIVGYSRLLADDFETTTRAVAESRDLVTRRLEENHGVLVDFVGDNFMAVFDDPMDAMRTSISITTDLEAKNVDVPESQRLRFRMGLDQGHVETTGDQYFGEALNVAARIQALAPPGGVSVSGTVYKALDEPELRFRPRGIQRLKNIPEPIEVFDFAHLPTGVDGQMTSSLQLGAPTIAVLPFHHTGTNEGLSPSLEVVRAELVHRLAQVPDLHVIDVRPDDTTPANQQARYMIESGAHEIEGQVRLYSALIDVTTMNVVKSHKWTVPTDELLSLSESLAEDVAGSVQVELVVGEPAGLYAELGDPASIQRIYIGWYHLTTETYEGWLKARQLFEEVVEAQPESPVGHSLLSFCWWAGYESGVISDRELVFDRAVESAQRGVALGDVTGLSEMVIASVLLAEGKPEEARELADQAVVTRPTCDVAFGLEGSVRRYLGQWNRSVDLMDNAIRLSGISKPWYPTVKACALYLGDRQAEAGSVAETVLEHQPRNLEALLILAAAQQEQGLERRARATANTVREYFPDVDIEKWVDADPYQDVEAVNRWKKTLRAIGLIDRY